MVENKVFWRMIVLALFILSLLGPWAFDRLYVPAQYPCGWPTVRLRGDFCGYPVSGFQALALFISVFPYMITELIRGNFAARAREFITQLFALIIALPFFSTLLLVWKKDTRRLQTINLIVWGLACVPALWLLMLQIDQIIHLWGLWLYVVVAIGTVIFEILVLRSGAKAGRDI